MVPVLDVEAEVDVEILVVVVMEDTVWLPGLPPHRLTFYHFSQVRNSLCFFYLERNTGVVNDAVVINIEQHEAVHS